MTATQPSGVGDFAAYVADRWRSDFHHAYAISNHASWRMWRALPGNQEQTDWSCDSLEAAARHWSWTVNPAIGSFADIARALQAAISQRNEVETERQCYEVFKWGGVARRSDDKSRVWVEKHARQGTLVAGLLDAVALLRPGSTGSLERFNSGDLLMNSAMTKVYAAADPTGDVAIYDGRVGAALGLLSRNFLESRSIPAVPAELMFMWGPPRSALDARKRTRDPSAGGYKYLQLPNGETSNQPRAEVSRRANRLFVAIRDKLHSTHGKVSTLDLERAMFMVGYRVRN